MKNTFKSEINELLTGFYLNGGRWFDHEVQNIFELRKRQISAEEFSLQNEKSQVMANEFEHWSRMNKYSGPIVKVWWTSRPGTLESVLGKPIDQRNNPTDILVKFTSGPSDGLLGMSAKETKRISGDIGFKNPGLGRISRILGLDLRPIVRQRTIEFVEKLGLPKLSNRKLKVMIRSDEELKNKADEAGSVLLSELRDHMFTKFTSFNQTESIEHIIQNWLDAEILFPPYVKVTGNGNRFGSISASVINPIDNPKMTAIANYPIRFESNGNESILVFAGNEKIMRIRLKYDSQKMAGSIKLSGDPT